MRSWCQMMIAASGALACPSSNAAVSTTAPSIATCLLGLAGPSAQLIVAVVCNRTHGPSLPSQRTEDWLVTQSKSHDHVLPRLVTETACWQHGHHGHLAQWLAMEASRRSSAMLPFPLVVSANAQRHSLTIGTRRPCAINRDAQEMKCAWPTRI